MISRPSRNSASAKPRLVVIIGRPGAGKSTLIKRWRPQRSGFHLHDVYPHMRRVAWAGKGKMDSAKTRSGYHALYNTLRRERHDVVLELGINHPDLNMTELRKLTKRFNVRIFLLLRNTQDCFAYKKKQWGKTFDSAQLRTRMRWPFPSVHERWARKYGLDTQRLQMRRGYPHAIKTIVSVLQ